MYFYSLNQENVISLWGLVNQAEPSLWSQTAVLNRNRLSTIMNSDNFKSSFLSALEDQEVVERYQRIFGPFLKSLLLLKSKPSDTFTALTQTISNLNSLMPSDAYMRRQTNQHWFR